MPRMMDRIVGHDRAKRIFTNALKSGRVHHAWIFYGPLGVGKFTTALAFARQLLGDAFQGHMENHPDLHVITKELSLYSDDASVRSRKQMTIPLDVLRSRLLAPAYVRSQMGGAKVFVVDEAEIVDRNGQNTMLKVMEEPPPGTYLILVTSREEDLLPTIRSRCQRVAFGVLTDEQVSRWLDENTELDPTRKADVIAFARGSIGRATIAIAYDQDKWLGQVRPMLDKIAIGRPEPEFGQMLVGLCDDFSKRWVDDHKNASKESANNAAVRAMLGLLGDECRRRMSALSDRTDPADPDGAEQLLQPWLAGADLIAAADWHLSRNVSPALLLDNLALQWCYAAGAA